MGPRGPHSGFKMTNTAAATLAPSIRALVCALYYMDCEFTALGPVSFRMWAEALGAGTTYGPDAHDLPHYTAEAEKALAVMQPWEWRVIRELWV